jgi:hypothetical protein
MNIPNEEFYNNVNYDSLTLFSIWNSLVQTDLKHKYGTQYTPEE